MLEMIVWHHHLDNKTMTLHKHSCAACMQIHDGAHTIIKLSRKPKPINGRVEAVKIRIISSRAGKSTRVSMEAT
jgi:hypothetical protein